MKLSVVIVSYNVKFYLAQCLRAVQKAAAGIETEIFVVDNNSTDGSVEYLKRLFPDVEYIENKENVGFARANNQAIVKAQGEYILLLNPDTIVGEDCLKKCVQFMDGHSDVGATGVRMLRVDGSFALESRRGIPTPFTSFCKMTGLCSLFPKSKIFGRYYMRYLDEGHPSPIEIISGACMFMRKKVLDAAGLLDEDFFMYGEDIDLSYRFLRTGYKNYYLPVSILHYKGESTQKSSFRYVYVFYQAMLIFLNKHYGHYSILISLPIKTAIYFKAFCTYITQQLKKNKNRKENNLEYMRRKNYLLVGTESNVKRMEAISCRYGLSVDTLLITDEILANGHTMNPRAYAAYDYIVYDCDVFSYDSILSFFTKSSEWRKRPSIATYSSDNNCIITSNCVFR